MEEYPKIDTVYKRNPDKLKELIIGDYSQKAFAYLEKNQWDFTEKVDGTNVRIMIEHRDDGSLIINFGGKTDNAMMPMPLIKTLDEMFKTPEAKERITNTFPAGTSVCLYGEGYGAGIQSGGNYSQTQTFILFDVKVGDWWLERGNVLDIAIKLDIAVVPLIGTGTLPEMVEMTRNGFLSLWGNFKAEGIVARPSTMLFNRKGERIITKIKYRDFPKGS